MKRSAMKTLVSTLVSIRLSGGRPSWFYGRRGSVSVEFVISASILVVVTVAGLDLYRAIGVRSMGARAATTMAEYMSQEEAPMGALMDDLATFSHKYQIGIPSRVAVVVSALSRADVTDAEPTPPTVVQWSRTSLVGEESESALADLGASCSRIGSGDKKAKWQTELGMEPGEKIIAVETCLQLLPEAFVSGGWLPRDVFPTTFYHQRIFPVRGENVPLAPLEEVSEEEESEDETPEEVTEEAPA